ncbi:hypothetical protein [Streptomyces sp. FIT100]|uniref:hypothetical protein n=1 Tax=Streptomyces sp. FIT100 TaxID=2837956 RepID=UPI0021C68DB0|nr:hypothetical protein [Streptomyces sp. FIT100]UUN25188.1 hypothetical protein KK483_01185 [Streptomyces sp. FIT100]
MPDEKVYEKVYEQLRIGERQSSVEDRLPAQEVQSAGVPAEPPRTGACRCYRTPADGRSPVYRRCFTDRRLSHKTELDIGE